MQKETWQGSYRHIFPAEFLDGLIVRPERWRERFVSGVVILVVEADGLVVGYCSSAPADEPGWGEIRAIYIVPSHQSSGLGGDLLDAGVESLRGEGFRHALLWVFERNRRARSFYERHGWSLGRPIRLEEIGGTPVTLVRYEKKI